jgi:hypothetical protein
MSGKYTKEMHEEYRKEQDEKVAKEEEARTARMEKEFARCAWLGDGGSEVDFEKAWPAMRDEAEQGREVGIPLA